jgi:Ca2+-binding EF-hand superfamily protein
MFDKDGSGNISADEIREVLGFGGSLSDKQISQIIKQVDENGDGEIDFDEFVNMMRIIAE